MKKSVRTAGVKDAPGSTSLKRQWFHRIDDDEHPGFAELCRKSHWTPVQTFGSWNDNDQGLGVAIDARGRIFLVGGKPHIQELNLVEAMEFYAAMFHEAQDADYQEGVPQFYRTIAAALQLRTGGNSSFRATLSRTWQCQTETVLRFSISLKQTQRYP